LGNAFSQATMTCNFVGCIRVVRRTREERAVARKVVFRDDFAALGAGILDGAGTPHALQERVRQSLLGMRVLQIDLL